MATRRPAAERHSVDAPGARLCFKRADLGGMSDPRESIAQDAGNLADVPLADRGHCGLAREFDRPPWWFPQRGKCPRLEHRGSRAKPFRVGTVLLPTNFV